MACYKPLDAWYEKGRKPIFRPRPGYQGIPIQLPCGQCIGCRISRSRDWATRCVHEAQMHKDNCFLTLTYNDDHLPLHSNLHKPHFQNFIRALRQKTGKKIRYYMCGEYGDNTLRPHYHAILFGYTFPDLTHHRDTQARHKIYRSKLLESLWTHGFSEIGAVTFQSAAYVARYIMKKRNGEKFKYHYDTVDQQTGEVLITKIKEYTQMSLKPGIGKSWYDKYYPDLFPSDNIHVNGRVLPVPSYYRKLLKISDPEMFERLRQIRIAKADKNTHNTPSRLSTRERCQEAKLKQLNRTQI